MNPHLEIGNSKLEARSSRLVTRHSRLLTRDSQLEIRPRRLGSRLSQFGFRLAALLAAGLLTPGAHAMGLKKKAPPVKAPLAEYIERVKAIKPPLPLTGSFWTPQSPYTDLASDYKAHNINDLIVIQVVESTTAAEDGAVKSARNLSNSSGITGLMGTPGPTSGLRNIFSANSTRTLYGQAQASSDATLTTSLSGRVVDVLPNGYLVIEAVREVEMNNQHQTVIIHGVVRPGDIGSNNAVLSTAVSNLELELMGRGVISDGVAPPNRLMRLILKLVGF